MFGMSQRGVLAPCLIITYINTRGHVNEYPTTHYFGYPRHTQSMIAFIILTEYFWKFQWKFTLWERC